jgi:hypothetical protein
MSESVWPRRLLPGISGLLALWSLVPLAIWWDSVPPAYFEGAWQTWLWGSAVGALAVALFLALSRGRVAGWLLAPWRRLMALPPGLFVTGAALVLAALTLTFTLTVFAANPRNVDGFAQLFQARIFLAGRLWMAPPAELANFGTLQMILGPDRWYAQYPLGQSLVLAAGLAAGAWWALHPLIAIALAAATYRVARWCSDEATARLTLILLCLSPFVVAVAGSEMSHLAAATLGMAAAAAAMAATERRLVLNAMLAGLLLGVTTALRPLDAVAAAVPVGIVLAGWCARRWTALAAAALGGVAGALPTLWYNAGTTGSWRVFGYTALWGPEHSLGFHSVPWGVPLTVTRALARSGMDLHQLNLYLLDSTVPVLLITAIGCVAGRRGLRPRDAVPFAAVLSLVGLLFFYWHRDVFYGPRFLYSVVAWFLLLLARALVLLRRAGRTPERPDGPGLQAAFAALAAIVMGLATLTPGRIEAYRRSTPIYSLHPDRDAEAANIHQAVVVVPDGWGTRLIARMWQQHIPVRRSSRLYGAIDACALEQALARAETTLTDAPGSLLAALDSLAARREPGVPARLTDDVNLRLKPGVQPAPECVAEIEVDRRGFLQFGPLLWLNNATLDGDVVWARDLGPRNAALFRRYAGRRFYRYAPGGPGGEPVFLPLDGAGW